MAQKLRKFLTIFMISALTFSVLMVGTYVYNSLALTKPLVEKVTRIPSIGSFSYEKQKTDERIIVEFTDTAKLRSSFYQLLDQIKEQLRAPGNMNMTIEISNKVNNRLGSFFKDARLPIQEAISTGEYTALPGQLDKLAADMQVEFNLEVDSDFIFLSADTGTDTAFIVIKCSDSPLTVITTMGGEYL